MGFIRQLRGEGVERATNEAVAIQSESGEKAIDQLNKSKTQALGSLSSNRLRALDEIDVDAVNAPLQKFDGVTQQGIDNAGFLTDPQAQYDYLQNNPLFKAALDNANQQTNASAAARGRLSAGDTLGALANNTLLAASPLIDRQTNNINNLLGFGAANSAQQSNAIQNAQQSRSGISSTFDLNKANVINSHGSNIANTLTGIGNAQAAGLIGAANAKQAGNSALLNIGASLAGSAIGSAAGTSA